MEILNSRTDLDKYYSSLCTTALRVLMLDYDGTLSPFTADRDRAYPYDRVESLLNIILKEGNTRMIIITGRPINDLLKLINFEILPEIWGSHGFECLMPNGKRFSKSLDEGSKNTILQYEKAFESKGITKYCEKKPFGIAVHWRGCSKDEIKQLKDKITKISNTIMDPSVRLTDFDGGTEIRICGIDKGIAVQQILSEINDEFISAYLGDDLTDEDAFRVLGDSGLKVLVRDEPKETAADIRLVPPVELIRFLENWRTCSSKKNRLNSRFKY